MTGQELCNLLGLNYSEIIGSRIHEQVQNISHFIDGLLNIPSIKELIKAKL